jgi:hypothetical protein
MSRDNVEIHFQWHDAQEWDYPNDRPSYRFVVQDVEELHREFAGSGVSDMTPVSSTPWGTVESTFKTTTAISYSSTGG